MMIRRTLTAALGAVVLLTSAMLPALPAEASETQVTVGSRQVEVTFNNPISAGGADWAHHDKLRRLIADAPAGAEIRLGIYYLTRDNIVDSLRDAVARGVSVYVVADGTSSHRTAQLRALATLLDSRMRICGTGTSGGCLSNASGGLMHAKYMLISQTKDNQGTSRSNVVWVSSANLTTPSGAEQFNNSVTIYDDESLYDGYMSQVWNPMWAGTRNYPGNDYYVASMPRGYFGSSASNSTVFVSPEQNTDLVANRLDNISPDSNCRIRVMQASFSDSRSAVADKLVSLKAGGCKVWIMVGDGDAMGDGNLAKFKRAGISVHKGAIHDKVILVSEGANNAHTWVLVGSHNLTESALRDQDNILMRLQDSKPLYDAYYAHFNDAYNNYPSA
ncbi:phosphatidylserine/phosphatidylglycerophosphate/cardiolipin synthase-like enzyme [Propionicimonas paludicola]|uniref:phospholipase D n=1 Tax=Propionicimonas paludicola TaxID=185243 RepID=A0A2A9CPM7_9ACTN|nr:phospholipase D-like domain-containing protein [Propionicimonas paludicola]PFG16343.1 phosphatidylserine/phosphatidylglycerophosphate/cardiolipin synthase-like enzyme [Propionicimonas paludicola]